MDDTKRNDHFIPLISEKVQKKSKFNWLLLAALLLIIAGFYLTYRNYISAQNRYDSYIEIPEGLAPTKGESTQVYEAMMEYKMENYGEAARRLEHLLRRDKNDTLQFYLSMSQMGMHHYDMAAESLAQLPHGSVYYNQGQYFLAIFDLFKGRKLEAIEKLDKLNIKPNFEYAEEVQKVLSALNK